MKRIPAQPRYRIEQLVTAAYQAAGQETRNSVLATLLASKILEDWLANSDRPDLLKQLQTASS
jgi:hypothetical protein